MHGGPWLEAYCFDGVKRMCHICGKMGRKVRIAVGDVVLISLRGFQVRRCRYFIFLKNLQGICLYGIRLPGMRLVSGVADEKRNRPDRDGYRSVSAQRQTEE